LPDPYRTWEYEILVRADHHDAEVVDRTLIHQRVCEIARVMADFPQDQVHQIGIGTTGQCSLLSLAHFRRGHHLHRFGDLRCILDRLYPPANVPCAWHLLINQYRSGRYL
jgi:hypothetical protein